MKFFVKDFCETVQARLVIFGMQNDHDILYHWIVNQPSHFFLTCICPVFLSFHSLNNEVFRQRYL